ncbi:flagellar type III secretion system pore protein FliP [Vulgatibacter sp.]|uniref:flagellar type III secretion system pore protein FliP n=1 Tax=Vulgatibacter sp. TaxID=1971226 RepID=UPI003563E990
MSAALLAAAAEPALQLTVDGGGSTAVKLFLLLTLLSFAAAILVSLTSFTRIVIVLSFLRQALGTPQLPPNQVLIGLALALSAFVMAPTATRVYEAGLGPYLADAMDAGTAFERASVPLREFLLRHTRENDLRLFYEIAGAERPARGEEIPLTVAVPAFMVSELTTAFRMGLLVYVPLLLVDLIVAAILMSLGMMMVPPNLISLPVKLGIFLLADGWHLVVSSLVRSFT